MLNRLFVYVFLPDEGWNPCGLLEFEEKGRYSTSRFRYGKKYLQRKNSFALDPVQLPLRDETIEAPRDFALFNGIRDAGPDKWGRYLLMKKFGGRDLSEIEYVAASGLDRVGALAFSDNSEDGPKIYSPNGFESIRQKRFDLAQCAGAVQDAMISEPTERLREFLRYGPSLGGARPKATVDWRGKAHLAKFSLSADERNEPLLEYSTMTLAQKCGLNVPAVDRADVLGRSIYLIERFDRTSRGDPIPFISALTITGLHEQDYSAWSYHLLVDAIVKYSSNPLRDLKELFKRMIFNIRVYNNDDHLRNFGFLHASGDRWDLSPLYDVLPATVHSQTFSLAMIIGTEGKKASISNALSLCERFRMTRVEAMEIIDQICEVVSGWRAHYKECGLTGLEIGALENSFSNKL